MPISRRLIFPTDIDTVLDECIANTTGNHLSWIKGHLKWIGEQLCKQALLPKSAFFRPDMKQVGSISQAALEAFGPILQRREQRFIDQLNRDSMMET